MYIYDDVRKYYLLITYQSKMAFETLKQLFRQNGLTSEYKRKRHRFH